MGLEVLVPLIMGALLKVAGTVAGTVGERVGDGVLGAVEESSKDVATTVFAKIKAWWSADPSVAEELERFTTEPDLYQKIIQRRLVDRLTADSEMQAELTALMEQAGAPQVNVFMSIATANGITGARIGEMTAGRVNVDLRIGDAHDVTGADITRLAPPGR